MVSMQSTEAEQKQEILDWIEAVIGEKIPKDPFEKVLKDGVLLSKYIIFNTNILF